MSAALLASGIASLLLGLGFAVVASLVSRRFEVILSKPADAMIFAGGVALGAVATVFDDATIGLLRGGVQLSRNLVFAGAKMALLPVTAIVLHDQFGTGITLSWIVGIAVSLLSSAVWLRVHGSPILPRPDWVVLRGLGRTTLAHNWLNLSIAVPNTVVPVLVTVVVSPAANAAFYIAWMLTSFVYAVPQALSTVLFAVASADPQVIARKLRFALKLSFLVGVPAMLVLCLGARFILGFFGAAYAREATFPLWLLSLAYVPGLPKAFYIAVCRAAGKITRAAVLLTAFAVVEIASAGIAGHLGGVNGITVAIFVVTFIEGAATAPAVYKSLSHHGRHRRPADDPAPAGGSAAAPAAANGARLERAGAADGLDGAAVRLAAQCVCGQVPDCPAHPDARRQQAGIAALVQLARLQQRPRE